MDSATVAKGSKASMWAIRLAGAGVVILLLSIIGAQFGLSPMAAMLGLGIAGLLLIIGGICALIGLIRSGGTAGGRSVPLTWAAAILGLAAIGRLGMSFSGGGAPIHDISTDLSNPPEFVAVAELRAANENPVAYSGAETAEIQRATYPDLETIVLLDPISFVYTEALGVADDMGWEIVAANESTHTIEATATTPFVGFKDDVVIRIRADSAETLVDVRSKSRLGRGDMGVNAARIREFRDRLLSAVNPE